MTNAEKYKTAKRRARAFIFDCVECRRDCSLDERVYCLLDWLDTEVEDNRPLPCPLCGLKVEHVKGELHRFYCECCNYKSIGEDSKFKAIATYNRVAKKCMKGETK